MYTSTYEMEKLAELRHYELVQNAERNRLFRSTRRRGKKTARVFPSPSCSVKEPTRGRCA